MCRRWGVKHLNCVPVLHKTAFGISLKMEREMAPRRNWSRWKCYLTPRQGISILLSGALDQWDTVCSCNNSGPRHGKLQGSCAWHVSRCFGKRKCKWKVINLFWVFMTAM